MTVYPGIPTMPGRSTSGFHRPPAGIACTKRDAKREVSGEGLVLEGAVVGGEKVSRARGGEGRDQ